MGNDTTAQEYKNIDKIALTVLAFFGVGLAYKLVQEALTHYPILGLLAPVVVPSVVVGIGWAVLLSKSKLSEDKKEEIKDALQEQFSAIPGRQIIDMSKQDLAGKMKRATGLSGYSFTTPAHTVQAKLKRKYYPDNQRGRNIRTALRRQGLLEDVQKSVEFNLVPSGLRGFIGLGDRGVFAFPATVPKSEVRYRWANNPATGEATPNDPAVLLIEKHPKLKPNTLNSEEKFYGMLDGVRRCIDVSTSDKNSQMWRVEYTDESVSLPSRVHPDDLPLERMASEGRLGDEFLIGVDEQETVQTIDFSMQANCLLAGGAGSGKSVLMNWILLQCGIAGVSVSMIDPDRQLPDPIRQQLDKSDLLKNYTIEKENWLEHLDEMEDRIQRRRSGNEKRKRMIFVVDEFSKLAKFEDNLKKFIEFGERSRKQKIMLLLVAQNPSTKTVPSKLRDNLQWSLVGNLQNPQQMRQIFPSADSRIEDAISQTAGVPGRFTILDAKRGELSIVQAPFDERLETSRDEGW